MSSLPFIGIYREKVSVLPTESKVVHSIPLIDFDSLDYAVSVKKADQTLNRSFRLLVNRLDAGLSDTVSAIVGSVIGYSVDVVVNGANAEVVVQNNEAFSLEVNLRCIKI